MESTALVTVEIKKVTVNLPKDLWRRVRVAAAEEDQTVTDLVRDWLAERISQREREREALAPHKTH